MAMEIVHSEVAAKGEIELLQLPRSNDKGVQIFQARDGPVAEEPARECAQMRR
jgi:hypothetical protein